MPTETPAASPGAGASCLTAARVTLPSICPIVADPDAVAAAIHRFLWARYEHSPACREIIDQVIAEADGEQNQEVAA